MKVGDKFIELKWSCLCVMHVDCAKITIATAKQISKNGLKVKTTDDKIFNIDSVMCNYKQIKSSVEPLFKGNQGILFDTARFYARSIQEIEEDDFDDIIHVKAAQVSGCVDFEGQCLQDYDESMQGGFKYFSTAEIFAEYLSALADFKKKSVIPEWLEKHGMGEFEEAEFRKNYSESDLIDAAANDLDPVDFERWQSWKRCLRGRYVPFELAMSLESAIVGFDPALSIYDFE